MALIMTRGRFALSRGDITGRRHVSTGYIKDQFSPVTEKDEKHFKQSVQRSGRNWVRSLKQMGRGKEILRGIPKEYRDQMPESEIDDEDPFYFENLVESRIKIAMKEGQFDNLPYTGEPLPGTFDMTVDMTDPAERASNILLRNSNVVPEWVEVNKEIREGYNIAKSDLLRTFRQLFMMAKAEPADAEIKALPSPPKNQSLIDTIWNALFFTQTTHTPVASQKPRMNSLSLHEKEELWRRAKEKFYDDITKVNAKIQYYNVLVPYSLQKYCYDAEHEMEKIVDSASESETTALQVV